MKSRPLPQSPELRDFSHAKPERLSPVFKDICAGCLFLVAVFMNVYLILGM
jgi:hypothetical protein